MLTRVRFRFVKKSKFFLKKITLHIWDTRRTYNLHGHQPSLASSPQVCHLVPRTLIYYLYTIYNMSITI